MAAKTTDRAVVTVVQADGWHVKTAYPAYERDHAEAIATIERLRPGVLSASVDLIADYKASRVVRVKVGPARREGTR